MNNAEHNVWSFFVRGHTVDDWYKRIDYSPTRTLGGRWFEWIDRGFPRWERCEPDAGTGDCVAGTVEINDEDGNWLSAADYFRAVDHEIVMQAIADVQLEQERATAAREAEAEKLQAEIDAQAAAQQQAAAQAEAAYQAQLDQQRQTAQQQSGKMCDGVSAENLDLCLTEQAFLNNTNTAGDLSVINKQHRCTVMENEIVDNCEE